ncbi:hypothetical protein D3C72_1968010 [compost metagenome]
MMVNRTISVIVLNLTTSALKNLHLISLVSIILMAHVKGARGMEMLLELMKILLFLIKVKVFTTMQLHLGVGKKCVNG